MGSIFGDKSQRDVTVTLCSICSGNYNHKTFVCLVLVLNRTLYRYLLVLLGVTAVREVFEETGVRAEFRSLLSIRQQHNHPGAFGMSDMYIICRLSPLTYDINFCTQECLRCEWLDLAKLAQTNATTPITSRIARLLLHGLRHGFNHIDLTMEEIPAVYSGMFYQLYHRQLPELTKKA